MPDEKPITFNEIVAILEDSGLRYHALFYSRVPENKEGTRVLFVTSDGVDIDNVRAARVALWESHNISVQIVKSDNTGWINRGYSWI